MFSEGRGMHHVVKATHTSLSSGFLVDDEVVEGKS